ncbi:hypothetical protein ACFLYF_04160 [Chloroflexota bacterium]
MSIEWLRDLVICIWGILSTAVLIFAAVLAYSLYRRAKPVLDSMKTTSANIQSLSTCVRDEVAKPLVEVAAIVQGVTQGIDMITKLFKKRKGGSDV